MHALTFSRQTCVIAVLLAGLPFQAHAQRKPAEPENPRRLSIERAWQSFYSLPPDPSRCVAGELHATKRQKILQGINQFRDAHGLPPIVEDAANHAQMQATALLGAVNSELSHEPSRHWICWSPQAAEGAKVANLGMVHPAPAGAATDSDDLLQQLIVDWGVDNLGHRRALLDPFLTRMAVGRADGFGRDGMAPRVTIALRTVYPGPEAAPRDLPAAIIYPLADTPKKHFRHGWFMSLSAIADPSSRWGNRCGAGKDAPVHYGQARIVVTDSAGRALRVDAQGQDCSAFGVHNVLKWQVPGTVDGETYSVHVSGVRVNGQFLDYQWQFKVVP